MTDSCRIAPEPSVSIGAPSGQQAYVLSSVFGASLMSDGRIVLVNGGTNNIRFYDPRGRHLMTAGREGDGPGEFRNPFYLFVLPGDTTWVGDYSPWRFHVYAPNGAWVRTVQPIPEYFNNPDRFGVMADGRAVLAESNILGRGGSFKPDSITIRVHAPTGELERVIGKFPNGRWGQIEGGAANFWTYPIFEAFTQMAVGPRNIVISSTTQPEIRVMDVNGAIQQIIRWDSGDRTVRGSDLVDYRASVMLGAQDMDSAQRARYLVSQVSENRPHADSFPPVTDLLIGRDDRIWARHWRRPSDSRPREWFAFQPDGQFVCRVRPPQGIEVYEFGRDYVLGLQEDSVGVERVVKHPLRGR
jgi:hypothetical protein